MRVTEDFIFMKRGRLMIEDDITRKIIGCAMKVHSKLGPGLLESVYGKCLVYELKTIGFKVEQQKPVPIHYEGVELEGEFRIDILVEDMVVLELKSVESVLNVHWAQVLTYLKLSGKAVGLLINFNVPHLRHGIKRSVNNDLQKKNLPS